MTRREVGQVLAAGLAASIRARAEQTEWTNLFDGKTLSGWDGDHRVWSVENGAIVGSSDRHSIDTNTFLIHKDPVTDFHLVAEVKLRNHNSGIQFRSKQLEGPGWVVAGYQADFSDAGDKSAWGNFYEERGRSRSVMRTPDEGWQRARNLVRQHDWNEIQVIACGVRIEIKLNGQSTIVARDDRSPSGVLALQLHSGVPMRVEFRNLRIRRWEHSKC